MPPSGAGKDSSVHSAPRTRGDAPGRGRVRSAGSTCSPHARGCSRAPVRLGIDCRLFPAPAGMFPSTAARRSSSPPAPRTRGDGPVRTDLVIWVRNCSPHTRGWTLVRELHQSQAPLLPARAGMAPSTCRRSNATTSAPRASGDGPCRCSFGSPTRGCCPRPRGWSRPPPRRLEPGRLLPPPRAGVVRDDRGAGILLPAPSGMPSNRGD